MLRIVFFLMLGTGIALAQQVDPAKLGAVMMAQRNNALDAVAQCSVVAGDLQAKIAELEKQVADLKAPK